MDHSGAGEPPGRGRRPSSHSSGIPVAAKAQAAQSGQRPQVKITPFHSSAILRGDDALSNKRSGSASGRVMATPGSRFLDTLGRLTGPHVRGRLSAAGSSEEPAPRPGSVLASTGEKAQPPARKAPKPSAELRHRAVSTSIKPPSAVKRRKRKMGMYNLVPKKKAKALKQPEKKEEPGPSVEKNRAAADEKAGILPETQKNREPTAVKNESSMDVEPGEGCHAEYTELALDCLDLKAQEELLSPPLSGVAADAEVTESELAEELPLCCCRMETPHSGGNVSMLDQSCMAMESTDGMLIRCQRRVMKQEMMRPSNTVHLLVLCEDHRAGMVKHHCCPGCGLFCRAGTFMECRPYGSISHRFHRDCASILRDLRFCPHCGEDASGAKEVTVSKADPSPSVPRSNPGPALPVAAPVATLPSVPTMPAVPQILRAKKTSEPQRSRNESPSSVNSEAVCVADRQPKESLESILMALDDDNLKPKKVKYPPRQLYISAKEGELQKVVHLLVDGKDPNFLMEGPNKGSPLHAAAAEGHQEVCHMLVQAGANMDMFDEQQRTPLMAACENSHLDTVKYLLRAGAAVGHK